MTQPLHSAARERGEGRPHLPVACNWPGCLGAAVARALVELPTERGVRLRIADLCVTHLPDDEENHDG